MRQLQEHLSALFSIQSIREKNPAKQTKTFRGKYNLEVPGRCQKWTMNNRSAFHRESAREVLRLQC